MTPLPRMVNYPGLRQIARVTRYREPLKKGPDDAGKGGKDYTGTVHLITSLGEGDASPEELPALNRGHWCGGDMNHRQRGPAPGTAPPTGPRPATSRSR